MVPKPRPIRPAPTQGGGIVTSTATGYLTFPGPSVFPMRRREVLPRDIGERVETLLQEAASRNGDARYLSRVRIELAILEVDYADPVLADYRSALEEIEELHRRLYAA